MCIHIIKRPLCFASVLFSLPFSKKQQHLDNVLKLKTFYSHSYTIVFIDNGHLKSTTKHLKICHSKSQIYFTVVLCLSFVNLYTKNEQWLSILCWWSTFYRNRFFLLLSPLSEITRGFQENRRSSLQWLFSIGVFSFSGSTTVEPFGGFIFGGVVSLSDSQVRGGTARPSYPYGGCVIGYWE